MADELSDEVKAQKDLLWGMYTDVRTHARHAETLRSSVVNFMIVVASVLITAISNDRRINRTDIALCLTVVLIGLVGLAFAASYTELHERNRKRAMRLRRALDEEFFANSTRTIAALLDEADRPHEDSRSYRWGRRLAGSTQRFWFVLPGFTLLAGLVLSVIAI